MRHVHAGTVGALEIVVLGLLAAYLVLRVVPSAFEIEWDCVSDLGHQRILGDSYLAGVVVAGTFGWLAVGVGVIYAQIAESPRVAVLLPIAWFGVLVAASLVAAGAMGPQLCPS
jgi:hypothetical protein